MLPIVRFGLLAGALAAVIPAGAQTPIRDTQYGSNGVAHLAFDIGGDKKDIPRTSVLLPDGSLLLGGVADLKSGSGVGDGNFPQGMLGKFTPGGVPDSNFGNGGRVTLNIVPQDGWGDLGDLALAPNGGFYVAGMYTISVNATPPYFLSFGLLKSDGTPDSSFNLSGYRNIGASAFLSNATNALVTRILPLPGGKLLGLAIVGNASQYCAGVIRLKSDGSTDTTFAAPNGLACYTSDSPTPTFAALDMAVTSGGKILVAGGATHGNDSSNYDMAVLRLLEGGAIDDTFGNNGWAFVAFDLGSGLGDEAFAIAVDSQERIVLAGIARNTTSYDMGIARLLADGQPDPDFGSGGRVVVPFNRGDTNEDHATSITVLPDDSLLIGGYANGDLEVPTQNPVTTLHDAFPVVARLKENGEIDPFFANNGRFDQTIPNSGYLDVLKGRTARSPASADYYFIVDTALKSDGSGDDFGATRFIVPIFKSAFDEILTQ
jgi:uncharacterized delta-60 repeat protein